MPINYGTKKSIGLHQSHLQPLTLLRFGRAVLHSAVLEPEYPVGHLQQVPVGQGEDGLLARHAAVADHLAVVHEGAALAQQGLKEKKVVYDRISKTEMSRDGY